MHASRAARAVTVDPKTRDYYRYYYDHRVSCDEICRGDSGCFAESVQQFAHKSSKKRRTDGVVHFFSVMAYVGAEDLKSYAGKSLMAGICSPAAVVRAYIQVCLQRQDVTLIVVCISLYSF